jgi:hypothetical protein
LHEEGFQQLTALACGLGQYVASASFTLFQNPRPLNLLVMQITMAPRNSTHALTAAFQLPSLWAVVGTITLTNEGDLGCWHQYLVTAVFGSPTGN